MTTIAIEPQRHNGITSAAGKIELPAKKRSKSNRRSRGRIARRIIGDAVSITDLIRFLDGVAIEGLAEESGVTAREIVQALPAESRNFISGTKFLQVLGDITSWGEVNVMLRTADGIVEFTTALPRPQIAHGYLHWTGDGPFRGRIRYDGWGDIAFVERSFMGRPSAAVLFFARDGNILFKIFVARDKMNTPSATQLQAFRSLSSRLAKRPANKRPAGHNGVRADGQLNRRQKP